MQKIFFLNLNIWSKPWQDIIQSSFVSLFSHQLCQRMKYRCMSAYSLESRVQSHWVGVAGERGGGQGGRGQGGWQGEAIQFYRLLFYKLCLWELPGPSEKIKRKVYSKDNVVLSKIFWGLAILEILQGMLGKMKEVKDNVVLLDIDLQWWSIIF